MDKDPVECGRGKKTGFWCQGDLSLNPGCETFWLRDVGQTI